MNRSILSIGLFLIVASSVSAAPWAQTFTLRGTTVGITNQQINSVWIPEVILWKFTPTTNVTLTVSRVSQGNTYLIGNIAASNVNTVIWIPEANYPFEYGDALLASSTVTNGQVQIIRKGN